MQEKKFISKNKLNLPITYFSQVFLYASLIFHLFLMSMQLIPTNAFLFSDCQTVSLTSHIPQNIENIPLYDPHIVCGTKRGWRELLKWAHDDQAIALVLAPSPAHARLLSERALWNAVSQPNKKKNEGLTLILKPLREPVRGI